MSTVMGRTPRTSFALVTTFGLGRLRPAPGTWGSLPPVVLAGLLIALGWAPEGAGLWPSVVYHAVLALVLLVFGFACIAAGDAAEARFNRKDPSEVVADETAGMCLPLMFLPATAIASPALAVFTLVYAFVAFRVMDIFKPFPARQLQSVPGGWGILLDDLVAGVYAAVLVQVLARVLT